jgi:hypothetical protein
VRDWIIGNSVHYTAPGFWHPGSADRYIPQEWRIRNCLSGR